MNILHGYLVNCWHAKTDLTFEITIPWQDACPPGAGESNRAYASVIARKRFADHVNEEYDFAKHKVLSIKEIFR